jgi:malonyl-CoA decarboxylase
MVMLSRWRAVRLALASQRVLSSSPTTWAGAAAYSSSSSSSSDVLMQSVRALINHRGGSGSDTASGAAATTMSAADLRSALAQAFRRRTATSRPALPSEVAAVLRWAYDAHRTEGPAARLRFFSVLALDFGWAGRGGGAAADVGEDVSAAHAAFERLLAASQQQKQKQQKQHQQQHRNQQHGHDAAALARAAARLRDAATPPYMRLLLPVASQAGGIAWLAGLRGDLLELIKDGGLNPALEAAPALRALAEDLRAALAQWFSPGLLRLRTLGWATTPASLLERAARADRVHPMRSLEDLRARLDRPDRRIFAFEHPSMPGDPLVVLHTALVPPSSPDDPDAAVPISIQQILGEAGAAGGKDDESAAAGAEAAPSTTTPPPPPAVACFYSVSSDARTGLAGVDLGHYLIKQAARALAAEFPSLQRFVTLSPLPLMRATVEQRLAQLAGGGSGGAAGGGGREEAPAVAAMRRLLASGDVPARLSRARRALKLPAGAEEEQASAASAASSSPNSAVVAVAAADLLALFHDDHWLRRAEEHSDRALFSDLLLPQLGAIYITLEKRRGLAFDPVAAFHLRNGALVFRVLPQGNRGSARALAESYGCMVNYRYDGGEDGGDDERNRRYLVDRVIAVGPLVEALLPPPTV